MAVDVVVEAPAATYCSDADRARAALEDALAAARAPRHTRKVAGAGAAPAEARWSVSFGVSAQAGGNAGKSVDAVIVDDTGAVVARRTIADRSARSCLPLARAVGAWASLVLDAELARAKDDDDLKALAPPPVTDPDSGAHVKRDREVRDAGVVGEGTAQRKTTIELGVMGYLRNGVTTTSGIGGVSPFVTIEVSPGWVLRPAFSVGWSTNSVSLAPSSSKFSETAYATQLALRLDFCRRFPGNYIERRGIELDLCAGIEASHVQSGTSTLGNTGMAGRVAPGPAMNLRGELGGGLALEVRALVGANLVTTSLRNEDPVQRAFASGELGVSMRLP